MWAPGRVRRGATGDTGARREAEPGQGWGSQGKGWGLDRQFDPGVPPSSPPGPRLDHAWEGPTPRRLPSFSVQRDASASTSPLVSATPGSPTKPARRTLGANLQAGVRLNYERLGGFYRRSIARVTGIQRCQEVFTSCCRTFQPSLLPSKCHFQLLRTICS